MEGDSRRESAARRCERLRGRVEAETRPVRVVVEPAGAKVIFDGDACGALLAPANRRLAPGTHALEVSAEGYVSRRESADIGPDDAAPLEVVIRLEPAPTTGRARFTSEPPGAAVTVAGREEGDTPLELDLPAGAHAVTVASDGYFTAREQIVVTAGAAEALHVTLVPLPAETGPAGGDGGWGAVQWTGVALAGLGVAAAGAGAGLHIVGLGEADDASAQIAGGLPHAEYASARDAYDGGAEKVSAALWLYGGAGALVISGVVLMLLPVDEPLVDVGIAPAPGGAVLRATTRWGGSP